MSAAADTAIGTDTASATRHRWYEDIQALVIGTLFVALGAMVPNMTLTINHRSGRHMAI